MANFHMLLESPIHILIVFYYMILWLINDTEVLWFGLGLNLTFKHCLVYWEFSLLPFLSAAS